MWSGAPPPTKLPALYAPGVSECYSPCHCFNFHVDLAVFVLMTSPQQPQNCSESINTGNHYGVSYFYCIFYRISIWMRVRCSSETGAATSESLFLQSNCHSWQLSIRNGGWKMYPQQWKTRGQTANEVVAFDLDSLNVPSAIELSSCFSVFLCNCHLLSRRMFGIFCKLYSTQDQYLHKFMRGYVIWYIWNLHDACKSRDW